MTVIWHNPRCSKSRQTLALLEEHNVTPDIRLYLEQGPSREEIEQVLEMLDKPALALMRTKDALFKELGLTNETPQDELIDAMVTNPKLIERPVVIKDGKARLGRPPEDVLEII